VRVAISFPTDPFFTLGEKDIPSVDELISGQSKTTPVDIQVDATSTATIPFSSGTTGLSKGVVLSHRNLVSNVLQLYAPETKYFNSDTTLLVPLPFFHIYGLVLGLLTSARHNAKTVFMPAFDLPKFLELAQSHKVTRTYIVPPIILALAKHPLVASYDLSSLKVIISGAAPLGGDVQEACAKRLNCIVKQAWGMTELSPGGAITPDELVTSPDSCKVIPLGPLLSLILLGNLWLVGL
jgi:acyl-CoA synthetase (AMP-forming)/AMP-acid ligase II